MPKILNEKNLILIVSFFLIIFVFINFINNISEREKYKLVNNNTYTKLDNFEFKDKLNQNLLKDKSYELILEKNCQITGDMHNRHKVRWVKAYFLKNIYHIANNLNSKLPYYINIILHSLLIFFSLILIDKTFNLKKKYIILFLLYVTFVFQSYLGEYSYSIFEMFFVSAALFASKRKNLLLFTSITSIAVLNRESGFIILLIWLIFNQNYKEFFLCFFITLSIFIGLNYQTINCMINPKFFIPLEPQEGQINFSDFRSMNILSIVKLLSINFIIPFGIIFYNFFKNKIKNNFYLIIVTIYLIVFLIATPAHHLAVKLIILPLIILSFYLPIKKEIN